jgi:tRNA nucleotidyltransferase (CCA-adding enzyme)
MVLAAGDLPDRVLERLGALRAGSRLLAVLGDPHAEHTRPGRRAPRLEGPLEGVHLVGGAVRDLLLGAEPRELDLVVETDAHSIADELRRRLGGRGRVHEAFGTASVEASDGLRFDVATARAEDYPRPGALPVVRAGSLDDDMARRDFSANAIAVGISADRRGQLHAAPGALEDLEARRLRVLHDRSFLDDPTRLLRLVRYATRLGFAIEPGTERLAREAFAAGAPATAGVARIGRELWLLLGEPDPVAALVLLRDLAGPDGLDPDLDVDEELLRRVLALMPRDDRPEYALLAALSRGAERDRRRAWLAGMHVPRPDRVDGATRDPEGLAAAMRDASRPSELARLLRPRPVEAAVLAGALGAEDAARRWLGDLRRVRLEITGADLLEAGVPQGPEIGRRLDAALDRKLDGEASGRDEELAAALAA